MSDFMQAAWRCSFMGEVEWVRRRTLCAQERGA